MDIKQHTQPMDKKQITKKIKKNKINENKNTAYQNLWDKVKAALRKKFITINTDIKGEERYQINNPNFLFNEL